MADPSDDQWRLWGPLADRYREPRPRKILALDGGGIRGVITLGMSIEDITSFYHEFGSAAFDRRKPWMLARLGEGRAQPADRLGRDRKRAHAR